MSPEALGTADVWLGPPLWVWLVAWLIGARMVALARRRPW